MVARMACNSVPAPPTSGAGSSANQSARVRPQYTCRGKLVSVFEPHTEIIRKGKANRPTEFGNLVKIQEAEHQIITHYEVFAERPSDSALLIPAVEAHQQQLGKTPEMVAACGILFRSQREGVARDGCQACLGAEPKHTQ